MSVLKGNVLYGQSGGPSPVINSSAYGVIKCANKHRDVIGKIYAAKNGIKGILEDNLYDIDTQNKEDIELLPHTPGAAFGSVRYKLKDFKEDDTAYKIILKIFQKYNIRYFFYNGGNDSMDTCDKINRYLKTVKYDCRVIGIPKTIDNDLPLTDHTPGFASTAKYLINSIMELGYDSKCYPKGRINIVEIMGRNAGWLTASSYIASINGYGPDLIYLPEVPFDLDKFIADVTKIYNNKNSCLVAVSEGIKDKNGNFISEQKSKDAFGHSQMGGVGLYLSNLLQEKGYNTRSIEPSLLQRSATHLSSLTDVKEAIKTGEKALEFALKGQSGKMVCIERVSSLPYKIKYVTCKLENVANVEKIVPISMINKEGNFMTKEFETYITPLLIGENNSKFVNGVVRFSKIK